MSTTESEPSESKTHFFSGTPARVALRDLMSGMAAGFVCKLAEYPFDTVKVLQQTQGSQYGSAYDCIMQTYRERGFFALYQGLASPLLGSMAECATLFVAYGYIKTAIGVDEEAATVRNPTPFWKLLLAGGGSGCFSACVLTPVELVKCRLQAPLPLTRRLRHVTLRRSLPRCDGAQVQQGLNAEFLKTQPVIYKGPVDVIRRGWPRVPPRRGRQRHLTCAVGAGTSCAPRASAACGAATSPA